MPDWLPHIQPWVGFDAAIRLSHGSDFEQSMFRMRRRYCNHIPSLCRLPFKVMLSGYRLAFRIIALLIVHMLAEIVQLSFIEARR